MESKQTLLLDIECYRNYFLVKFMHDTRGTVREYEIFYDEFQESAPLNSRQIVDILRDFRIVTFNGKTYDIPMLVMALTLNQKVLRGELSVVKMCSKLKAVSDHIILSNLRDWQFEQHYQVKVPTYVDHIDIIEVAPGVMVSLKAYGARMHSKRLQDLPIEPDEMILPEQRPLMRDYCGNDLRTTRDLWERLQSQIKLRSAMSRTYGIDLRSKSDAQIAEAVLKSEIEKVTGRRIEKPYIPPGSRYSYRSPGFVQFERPELQQLVWDIESAEFAIGANGQPVEPAALEDREITIGKSVYRLGLGGLHSSETSVAHFADDDHDLVDRDVASYYPAIIIRCMLFPKHMGEPFLKVYKSILDKRIAAKRAGEKVVADSLKITLNGTFGKLGSKYSILYAPDLMLQVTITGQLCLLMLIEALDAYGIPVVSANTDGIVIRCPKAKRDKMDLCIQAWERRTGFETEETRYRALYSRDVNNYIALKEKGGSKGKGEFTETGLMKNPQHEVCNMAVNAFLENGTPLAETVYGCTDVRKFIVARKVTGGGTFGGDYLGKTVRWVYARGEKRSIHYKKPNKKGNFNTVAGSTGAMPLMELPDAVPSNLDYEWYVTAAAQMLCTLGTAAPTCEDLFV